MASSAELLSTSAASHDAGVSSETIRQWVRGGRLPAQRTPLGALIDPADLGRLISQREAQRTQGRTV